MALRKLLVIGATGKQGGAVIDALLGNERIFDIYGLTRNATSSSAVKLAKRNVTIIEGDMSAPEAIFKKLGSGLWGVFCMTNRGKHEDSEGKLVIDAAIASGAKFFVFSSADRGGPAKSDIDPTPVPHLIAKYNIEKHLIQKAAKSPQKMAWTILRPTAFMEGIEPNMMGKGVIRMMYGMGDTRLQFVSTRDIGELAARAFNDPESYKGKSLTLAGASLNFKELNKIFKEELGYEAPMAPGIMITLVHLFVSDIGKMFDWFGAGGYDGSIAQYQADCPGLMDFRTWLRQSGMWEVRK